MHMHTLVRPNVKLTLAMYRVLQPSAGGCLERAVGSPHVTVVALGNSVHLKNHDEL